MKSKTVNISSILPQAWYGKAAWVKLLLPLSWLFRLFVSLRRRYYRSKHIPALAAPVIVVGNLTLGGTGKTPLLISMVEYFKRQGYRPGVISRGYGGEAHYPCLVTPQSQAQQVGDEPLLIAASCPVVVDPDRYRAAQHLLEVTDCNVIFSDDGLQHYRLPRNIEIVVVDGSRQFGNGYCLPAGPMREPISRLVTTDYLVANGETPMDINLPGRPKPYYFTMQPQCFRNLVTGRTSPLDAMPRGDVHAVAGIGNPQRFADTLCELGFNPRLWAYPDHHVFSAEELAFDDGLPVIITAKDAVKCQGFGGEQVWVLDVVAEPPEAFLTAVENQLRANKQTNK